MLNYIIEKTYRVLYDWDSLLLEVSKHEWNSDLSILLLKLSTNECGMSMNYCFRLVWGAITKLNPRYFTKLKLPTLAHRRRRCDMIDVFKNLTGL